MMVLDENQKHQFATESQILLENEIPKYVELKLQDGQSVRLWK